jgi:hypothetical protein
MTGYEVLNPAGLRSERATPGLDCSVDPRAGLKTMFVDIVQQDRIDAGQFPALRPVFLKPHGIAHGTLTVRRDADPSLRCGIFAGERWPVWLRFSSDTVPQAPDFRTTLGVAMKVFGVPGPKLIGDPDDVTFDLIFQNHDVFFVDTARDMCAFIRAVVVDRDVEAYLAEHPETAAILDAMAKPEPSVLAAHYWSLLPIGFGGTYAKLSLTPSLELPPLADAPGDPNFLAADLAARLKAGPAHFALSVQLRTHPVTMPLDSATVPWDTALSPFLPLADLVIDRQDILAGSQATFGENLSFNMWRVTPEHSPAGTIAEARRAVYSAAATLRRRVNGVPDSEPKEP